MALPSAGPTDCSSGLSARIFNNLRYDNPWQALQSGVQVGTLCCPTVPAGIGFKCTAITTGITGAAEPTWPTILTNTVVDGGVTWTAQDVANPTGKAHPPAGQFGYLFTSTDLDGFRLLAYDIARAVADEIGGGPDYCALGANSSAGQTIANGATPIVVFGTVEKDSDSAYNSATGRWTCPSGKGGDYSVTAEISYSVAMPTGLVAVYIFKNAGLFKLWQKNTPAANEALPISGTLFNVVAGDIIDIRTAHNEAAGKALNTNPQLNYFALNRILGS